jgi:sugar fermentation stimulation protein A
VWWSLIEILDVGELVECRIIKRTSRFTVLVEVKGERVLAYTNNTGRLESYLTYNKVGYLTKSNRGVIRYRIIGVEDCGYAALIDTKLQEEAFEKLVSTNVIPWLRGFRVAKRYPRVNGRVFDFLLLRDHGRLLVELKSAVLRLNSHIAGYPDAPTKRGREQLVLLGDLTSKGIYMGLVVFISALPRVNAFQLYCGADKLIEEAVKYAAERGVVFKSIGLHLDPYRGKLVLENPDLPVILKCNE